MEIILIPKGKSTGRKPKYMLSDIELGETKLFHGKQIRQCVSNYIRRQKEKGNEIYFICRKEKNGIRVQRTK